MPVHTDIVPRIMVCARDTKTLSFHFIPVSAFPKKRRGPGEHPRRPKRGERWGKRFFMSRCHGTPTIDACHNLVQLLLPLYSSHVHMVHGAMTAPCNIEASSSLDCSKLKTDEIVPIFTGGPGNRPAGFSMKWNGREDDFGKCTLFYKKVNSNRKVFDFLIKNLGRRSF